MTEIRNTHFTRLAGKLALAALLGLALAGCNAGERLSRIGKAPDMSELDLPVDPKATQQAALSDPRAQDVGQPQNANSLWKSGSRTFFEDQRASERGDIVTVVIQMNDSAEMNNTTNRSRNSDEQSSLNSFLGYETRLRNVLPNAVDPGNLVSAGSTSDAGGTGNIAREEEIDLRIAALVTEVLPNGNLVIAGRQETRVNFELRELQIAGIIRPADISNLNEISYDKIAEARVSYGGRGELSDVQQPRYGQQVFDIIWPF
ncbi:flagellar basal body L-ring protein FlgH [Fodinicurvata sediminis]|uniref:flagellar basal body L-ring protein FlgH n=1 Tax=Fodinicurvata sediminis TaxID=1121832 RepID=UPI0003B4364F|nr:flagellar basal body L-ring protein FlgH [Fodinicurvata sediminis]